MAGMERPTIDRDARRERKPPSERLTLVTGGSGFVGPFLALALLETGRRVVNFDIRGLADEGKFVLGERLDEVAVELGSIDDKARFYDVVKRHRPDEIVHMAMIIDPAILTRSRSTAFRVNVEGTVNVLESMLLFDVDRLVYFSSIGVLPKVQYEPIDAKHPVFLADSGPGTDFYGSSKVAGEALCFAYLQSLALDARIIRPSAVYGLGMTPWPGPIKPMVEGAVRGEQLRFETGGRHPRSYTHAIDVAGLVLAMLEAPDGADRIFYGATGEPLVTTSEVARLVTDVVPGADIEIGEELSPGEVPVVALRGRLSIENARGQLGWEPRYSDLRDGIAQYAEQYRAFLATI